MSGTGITHTSTCLGLCPCPQPAQALRETRLVFKHLLTRQDHYVRVNEHHHLVWFRYVFHFIFFLFFSCAYLVSSHLPSLDTHVHMEQLSTTPLSTPLALSASWCPKWILLDFSSVCSRFSLCIHSSCYFSSSSLMSRTYLFESCATFCRTLY
jgi:hypothetical protein